MQHMLPMEIAVKQHTPTDLEFKIHYRLNPDIQKERFICDFFLFIPETLEVRKETLPPVVVLNQIKDYIRHSAAELPLSELVDNDCDESPLKRLKTTSEELKKHYSNIVGKRKDNKKKKTPHGAVYFEEYKNYIAYELKTLVNIFRVQLRNTRNDISKKINSQTDNEDALHKLHTVENHIRVVLDYYRSIAQNIMDIFEFDEEICKQIRWTDESLSLITEEFATKLHSVLHYQKKYKSSDENLIKLIKDEHKYRKKKGYSSVPDLKDEEQNEYVVYHKGLLKKWSQEVLYLNKTPRSSPERITDIVAGIAAGLAMGFAVMATVFMSRILPSSGITWGLIVVLIYIFKDRIKDGVKGVFSGVLRKIIADRVEDLIEPASKIKTGKSSTRLRYENENNLPPNIIRLRNKEHPNIHPQAQREQVMSIRKVINLNSSKLTTQHARHVSLTEIIRINIERWLVNMDRPRKIIPVVKDGKIQYMKAVRVYHINCVIRLGYNGENKKHEYLRYRVVINRKGIKRITPVHESEKISGYF